MERQINRPAPTQAHRQESEVQVNVIKKLQNPFALVVQGFIVGGVLFWTTQGQATQAPMAPAPIAMSVAAD
jgi:hypothetical protein